MNEIHWKLDVDKHEIVPRSYNLSRWEDKLDFVVDFKITACLNLLKYVAKNYRGEDEGIAELDQRGEERKRRSKRRRRRSAVSTL